MSGSAFPENHVKSNNVLEIRLLGQKIALRSPGTDPELVRQVADFVTARLGEVESRAKGAAAHQVALLALLEVTAEYLQARQRTAEFKKEVEAKSEKLLGLIEAELK